MQNISAKFCNIFTSSHSHRVREYAWVLSKCREKVARLLWGTEGACLGKDLCPSPFEQHLLLDPMCFHNPTRSDSLNKSPKWFLLVTFVEIPFFFSIKLESLPQQLKLSSIFITRFSCFTPQLYTAFLLLISTA